MQAVMDRIDRPISFFMTAGQISDYTGAASLLDNLLTAKWLLADRGYDADWFRGGLQDWRRVATRYDRCSAVFHSAVSLAAIIMFWLCVLSLA
ncbi:transposase [Neokomagataea thailandica NBRC 106555]|uniref:Transposase n=1 Tax=Neokomagataea thailandica NBRC 106555 TaxID=1223520 RepID=A0ABQ0QSF9_9PROT|nr:transposase [Neokomagataea thailandica NBRC 106555]